ncbi:MAG: protein kinase, partial [Propionibacteriaceae bacterium]|nr:protein kinase [Propionibacteriaceae bacterium]
VDQRRQRRDDDATVDQRASRSRTGRLRTILPEELLARFEPSQNLNVSAGQADLVLCRDRATGDEVIVKLYRNAAQLDREVLAKLYQADPAHVVRLIDHGDSDGEPWEVQEYCALGTLTDHRLDQGGQMSEAAALEAVRELAESIDHIHGLGITHRDLKPENVLVRSASPLDLVLTDFGVAAEQIVTVQLQTVAASWAWAAPEVHTKGAVAHAIDWWALGAMAFQMITGRHVLAGPDGRLPADSKQIRATVVDGLYTTEALASPRWRNLVDGLLSYNPAQRWGHAEVTAWLAGRDPVAVRTVPVAELGQTRETRELRYVFNGHPVRTGLELVHAMRLDWQAAGDLLSGRLDPALEDWLKARPDGETIVRGVGLEKSGGARLIRLQAELDPGGPLEFHGRRVDDESLNDAIRQAGSWRPGATGSAADAHAWLKALRQERVLGAMAAVVEGAAAERLGRADQLLDAWAKQTRDVLDAIPDAPCREVAEGREQAMLSFLFSAALGDGDQTDVAAQAVATAKARDTDNATWAEGLAGRVLKAAPGDLGLLVAAEPVIAQVTSENQTRKKREQAEREARKRREREARDKARRERLARERRDRNSRRWSALKGQVACRGIVSVGYSAMAGYMAAMVSTYSAGGFGLAWERGWPILVICLVTVAVALVVDWFLDNPGGGLRRLCATAGLCVGAAAWVEYGSIGMGQRGTDKLEVMPWAFGASWVIGSVLSFALDRAWASHDQNSASRRVERAWFWRLVPTALGAVAGVSAMFFGRCYGDCGEVAWEAGRLARHADFLHFDPLGVGGSAGVVFALAVVACALSVAAPTLARLSRGAGIVAAVAGPALGLLVFFSYRLDAISLVVGAIMRAV